jgi:hypothetical protein
MGIALWHIIEHASRVANQQHEIQFVEGMTECPKLECNR